MGACSSSSATHENQKFDRVQEISMSYEVENIGRAGSLFSKVGSKTINQDSAVLCQKYGVEDGYLGGVFDGHGLNGHEVSQLVKTRLPSLLLKHIKLLAKARKSKKTLAVYNIVEKWKDASINAFQAMQNEIDVKSNLDTKASGSTAVLVIRQGEDLVIANLGDSRAVLGTMTDEGIKAVPLTVDHKPSVKSEADRIRRCGGKVLSSAGEAHIERVWIPIPDTSGLAMSRSFGDSDYKRHGVVSLPEMSSHRISPNDQFVILASDGIWDVLSNEQVVSFVSSMENKDEDVAEALVNAATAEWKIKYPKSPIDDCSVVYLSLKNI